jgi:pyruvate formate lyase activating enzyme
MGMIFNIQEFAISDGEGIRTTVFLKGCPLICKWCSNPEGQIFIPDLFHDKNLCQKCLDCLNSCPHLAVTIDDNGFPVFNRKLCSKCMNFECIKNCTSQGIKIIGEDITARELFNKIITNQLFYRNSGGGVTLSGGEPFSQPEFVNEFLELCTERGISVGIETCGLFNWNNVKNFIDKFEFFYFDLKCINPELHKLFTGSDNKIILKNLKLLTETSKEKITICIPLIPGFNDSSEVIDEIISCCRKLNLSKVRLLPYHNFGESKYSAIGSEYKMSDNISISSLQIEAIKQKFEKVKISYNIE